MRQNPSNPDRREVLQGVKVAGAALLSSSVIARAETDTDMNATPLTADEVRTLLDLEPNATCGFVRPTFVSQRTIAPNGLAPPFSDGRPLGSALYFMVAPGAPVRLHRIRNDQLYHYYMGDPIEVFLLQADGKAERVVVGPDLRNGERVQLFIPGNTFHTGRLLGQGRWFLGASTEWPGVVPAEDVEIGNLDEIASKYASVADELRAIAASVEQFSSTGNP
jgi:predicted cupin superfamily sugar epimerase